MAKNSVTDWSETAADNTDIGGVNIAEGCAPSGINNAIRTVMAQIKAFFKSDLFRLRDNTDETKLLAFDLSGITTATTRTLTMPDADVDLSNILLADRRNRIVNHDMALNQENSGGTGTANGYYGADQWATYRVTSAGVITTQRVESVTPAGGRFRYRVTITTADASLAAGEYLTVSQNLEGSNVADFQYGGSAAVDSVLRFGFRGPAGTYAVHLGNSAANRSYVALFTIAAPDANTDTVQTFSIPGDTTGTWLKTDGVIGITLDIVLAAGTTFQGATGWQAGNILATTAISNGMGTGSAVFELFDVGMKLDPDATGAYGQYEAGEVDAVYRSERYFERLSYDGSQRAVGAGWANTANIAYAIWEFAHSKCKDPTITGSAAASDFGFTYRGTSSADFEFNSALRISQKNAQVLISGGSGLSSDQGGAVFLNGASSYIQANARLS